MVLGLGRSVLQRLGVVASEDENAPASSGTPTAPALPPSVWRSSSQGWADLPSAGHDDPNEGSGLRRRLSAGLDHMMQEAAEFSSSPAAHALHEALDQDRYISPASANAIMAQDKSKRL